jgi:hypothetical protein
MGLVGLASRQSIPSASAAVTADACVVSLAAAMCQNLAGTHTGTAREGGCSNHNTKS